jgi:hypothetical protein
MAGQREIAAHTQCEIPAESWPTILSFFPAALDRQAKPRSTGSVNGNRPRPSAPDDPYVRNAHGRKPALAGCEMKRKQDAISG